MIGNMVAIDSAITVLKSKRWCSKLWKGYLSCKIKFSNDKKRAWSRQPHLIKNMEKKFGKHMQDVWSHKTPGTSMFLIIRLMIKSKNFSAKDQQEYWSGVDMWTQRTLGSRSHP